MADSDDPLDQVTFYQAGKEVTLDELVDQLSPSGGFGRHHSECAGLVWAYNSGVMLISNVPTKIAKGTVTLTASTTCYLRLSKTTGAVDFVTSAPSGWPGPVSGFWALYEIVVGTDAPTSWKDWRPTFNG